MQAEDLHGIFNCISHDQGQDDDRISKDEEARILRDFAFNEDESASTRDQARRRLARMVGLDPDD